MRSVVQTPHVDVFSQLVNLVAETVGILVLSDDVGVSMCVLRSFAVFVIIIVTIFVATVAVAAAAAAAAAAVMTDVSFVGIFIIFGQTVHVVAETVVISRLQGRFVSVCPLLRSFAVHASIRYGRTNKPLIIRFSVYRIVCVLLSKRPSVAIMH